MIYFFEYLTQNLAVQAFGLSLLHSLWQGALIASVLWFVNQWITSRSAQWRYRLGCLSLLLLMFSFSYTFYQEYQYLQALQKLEVQSVPFTVDQSGEPPLPSGKDSDFFTQLNLGYWQVMQWFSSYSSYIFLFWLTGFMLFTIRLSMGLRYTEMLVRHGKPLPPVWMRKLELLQEKMGYHRKIRLLFADAVTTPFTFGWIKPVIMFPVSLLTQLPADQIESILLHELAHIKRRDYLINLFQALAEIAFFFNPGFWYISAVLEKERENACDDLVIKATHDRVAYARALTNLAALCQLETISSAALAIAQKKQSLMRRIQRIVYYSQTNPMMKNSFKSRWDQLAMISMVCMLLAFITMEVKGNKVISGSKTAEIINQEKESQPDTIIQQGKIKLKSINGMQAPLYIVDGNPVDSISNVDAEDVVTVDVLKDGKAFVLYGEKGKNGVVIMTTRFAKTKDIKPANVKETVYFLDGKEINKKQVDELDPGSIESMWVYKGPEAFDKYGKKGAHGVVDIVSRKYHEKTQKTEPETLFVLDGKIIARDAVRKEVNEDEILQMEILKGQNAIDKYDEKGKNGVVLITSKGKQPPTKHTKKDGFSESLSVFPNPSAHAFTIQFSIAENVPVEIKVLDKNGILVAKLLDKTLKKGVHEITWEATSQKPGVYTVTITQGAKIYSRHIIVK